MTYTITLSPETETVIARRAARLGMSISGYMAHMADVSAHRRMVAEPKRKRRSQLTDADFNNLLESMSLSNAVPVPADVDIREIIYEDVGK